MNKGWKHWHPMLYWPNQTGGNFWFLTWWPFLLYAFCMSVWSSATHRYIGYCLFQSLPDHDGRKFMWGTGTVQKKHPIYRLKPCPHRRLQQSHTMPQSCMRLCRTAVHTCACYKAACDKAASHMWQSHTAATWQQAPVWTAVRQSLAACYKVACGFAISFCVDKALKVFSFRHQRRP